jgi:excisionase family DNA binding protein
MPKQKPSDLITVAEARALLGVSRVKIAQLLKRGDLRYFTNPLDGREKLISRAEVEALKPKRAEAA